MNLRDAERNGAELTQTRENDDFDITLESNTLEPRRLQKGGKTVSSKRQKKDARFGFGGKKRHSKSSDAVSGADLSNFSVKRMKNPGKKHTRPGKARRTKAV